MTQYELRTINPFSINNNDVSLDASATSDSPPTSHPAPAVAEEPPPMVT